VHLFIYLAFYNAQSKLSLSLQVNEDELHHGDLSVTSVSRDPEVDGDGATVECNGDIATHSACSHDRCLRRKVDTLNAELTESRQLVTNLRKTEQSLRQRLKTHVFC